MKAGRNPVTKISTWIPWILLLLATCFNVFNMQQRRRVKRFAWSPRCFDFMYKSYNLYLHETQFSFWTLYQKCAILQESPQFRQHIYIRDKKESHVQFIEVYWANVFHKIKKPLENIQLIVPHVGALKSWINLDMGII